MQVKYQYNLSIFGVKLESEINININYTGKTYQLIYVHRSRFKIKSKNVPYFEDCAKCFDNILNKGTKFMNTQQEL